MIFLLKRTWGDCGRVVFFSELHSIGNCGKQKQINPIKVINKIPNKNSADTEKIKRRRNKVTNQTLYLFLMLKSIRNFFLCIHATIQHDLAVKFSGYYRSDRGPKFIIRNKKLKVFPLSHVDHVANDLWLVQIDPWSHKQRIVMLPWGIVGSA